MENEQLATSNVKVARFSNCERRKLKCKLLTRRAKAKSKSTQPSTATYTNDYFLVLESTPSSAVNLADNESEAANFMHVKTMKINWVDKILISLLENYKQRCSGNFDEIILRWQFFTRAVGSMHSARRWWIPVASISLATSFCASFSLEV